jgi:hypothetical protein
MTNFMAIAFFTSTALAGITAARAMPVAPLQQEQNPQVIRFTAAADTAGIAAPMAVAARSITVRRDGTPGRTAGAASAIGKLAGNGRLSRPCRAADA